MILTDFAFLKLVQISIQYSVLQFSVVRFLVVLSIAILIAWMILALEKRSKMGFLRYFH